MYFVETYISPLGAMTMVSDGEALCGLWFDGQRHSTEKVDIECCKHRSNAVFDITKRWLDAYFDGRMPTTPPSLSLHGSPFRMMVWKALESIPYGVTATYGEIAQRLMKDGDIQRVSARAVGGAVGHNPIAVIVPCHRVVGAGFSASFLDEDRPLHSMNLTGYAAGIERKLWLLRWERGMRNNNVMFKY